MGQFGIVRINQCGFHPSRGREEVRGNQNVPS